MGKLDLPGLGALVCVIATLSIGDTACESNTEMAVGAAAEGLESAERSPPPLAPETPAVAPPSASPGGEPGDDMVSIGRMSDCAVHPRVGLLAEELASGALLLRILPPTPGTEAIFVETDGAGNRLEATTLRAAVRGEFGVGIGTVRMPTEVLLVDPTTKRYIRRDTGRVHAAHHADAPGLSRATRAKQWVIAREIAGQWIATSAFDASPAGDLVDEAGHIIDLAELRSAALEAVARRSE